MIELFSNFTCLFEYPLTWIRIEMEKSRDQDPDQNVHNTVYADPKHCM